MAAGTVVEVVTEEVAANLEEVAQATRAIDTRAIGFFGGGLGAGVALGFFLGYRFNREKLRLKAFEESQAEIDEIRDEYRRRTAVIEKPELEKVIQERGYDSRSDEVERIRALPAPVPILDSPHPTLVTPYQTVSNATDKDKDTGWDYAAELANRTQEAPYIIHEDEMRAPGGYDSASYTYYAEDDILVDEDDRPIPNPDTVVGENNLRFGHGSDSPDIVFVRNDRLELDMEICRSSGSYEREVVGLETEQELEHSDRRVERHRRVERRYRSEDESS